MDFQTYKKRTNMDIADLNVQAATLRQRPMPQTPEQERFYNSVQASMEVIKEAMRLRTRFYYDPKNLAAIS